MRDESSMSNSLWRCSTLTTISTCQSHRFPKGHVNASITNRLYNLYSNPCPNILLAGTKWASAHPNIVVRAGWIVLPWFLAVCEHTLYVLLKIHWSVGEEEEVEGVRQGRAGGRGRGGAGSPLSISHRRKRVWCWCLPTVIPQPVGETALYSGHNRVGYALTFAFRAVFW